MTNPPGNSFLFVLISFSLVLTATLGCSSKLNPDQPWVDAIIPGEVPKVSFYNSVEDYNSFAIDSYAKVLQGVGTSSVEGDEKSDLEKNIVYSPYAMSTMLEILRLGAKSDTAKSIEECMDLPAGFAPETPHSALFEYTPPPQQKEPSINYPPIFLFAHSLWIPAHSSVREEYQIRTQNDYSLDVFSVDFQTNPGAVLDAMNAWIRKTGQNRIPELASPPSPASAFVLLQTLYFKAHWEKKFQHFNTKDRPFTLVTGETVVVPTMYEDTFTFRYAENETVQVLEMPYCAEKKTIDGTSGGKNYGDFSMVCFLPKEIDGIREFERTFSRQQYEQLINSLKDEEKLQVQLPKFRIEQEIDLTTVLNHPNLLEKTDFSAMGDFAQVSLENVKAVQRITLGIDEHGTEVALLGEIGYVSLGYEAPKFIADHPFLFVVRERKSNAILFIGRVMNPAQSNDLKRRTKW